MDKNEIWKDVQGFEAFYEVSNLGDVRTKYREYRAKTIGGVMQNRRVQSKMKTKNLGSQGYYTVALVVKNKTYNTLLHRIIAFAFVDNTNPLKYKVINHKNGIKTDNRVENLEWCTSSINNLHALQNKLRKPVKTALTKNLAHDIDKLKTAGLNGIQISEKVGLSSSVVQKYLRGKAFKYQW